MIRNFFVVLGIVVYLVFACKKSVDTSTTSGTITSRKQTLSNNAPNYGDTLVYVQWRGPKKDYIITPKKIKDAGVFVALPQGLMLDRTTGEINVSKSETGIRYKIGFVKANTTDTAYTTLVIGGLTYLDGIYSMDSPDTLAVPFYNASPVQSPVCDASDDTDYPRQGNPNRSRCEFDDDEDLDSPNGKDDEPPSGQSANKKKLRVRKNSGVISLKKSLTDGLFGTSPQNGANKKVTIYYRLDDKSKKVLQSITVELTYYNRRSDIPASQQTAISSMRNGFMQHAISTGKPRPPQIVITRHSY